MLEMLEDGIADYSSIIEKTNLPISYEESCKNVSSAVSALNLRFNTKQETGDFVFDVINEDNGKLRWTDGF